MQDELRLCASCHHEHKWGILGYSQDGVRKYGARRCEYWQKEVYGEKGHEYWKIGDLVKVCDCQRFVNAADGDINLPTLTNEQTQALWSKTSFLNAQVPAATRIAISGILQLLETGAQSLDPAIAGAIREFMGLMVSQITDVRGALTRDDSKFALLVSHTDEIVEAMKGVVQLKERLDSIYEVQERVLEAVGLLFAKVDLMEKQNHPEPPANPLFDAGILCMACPHLKHDHNQDDWKCSIPNCECAGFSVKVDLVEAVQVFAAKSAPLWNEPIVTDASASEDSSD